MLTFVVFSFIVKDVLFGYVKVPLYEESVNFPSALFTFIVSVVDTVLYRSCVDSVVARVLRGQIVGNEVPAVCGLRVHCRYGKRS